MLKSVWVTDSESTPLSVTLQFNLADPALERRREAVGIEEGGRYIVIDFIEDTSESDTADPDSFELLRDASAEPRRPFYRGRAWSNDPQVREALQGARVAHVDGIYPAVTLNVAGANLVGLGFTDQVTAFASRDGRREQSRLHVILNRVAS